MDQNVNKPKDRAAKTVYGTIFLPFYLIIIFFLLANKTGSVIGCNLSKKHKLALYQIQSGEPNYVHNKILL